MLNLYRILIFPLFEQGIKVYFKENHCELEKLTSKLKLIARESWLFLKSPIFLKNFGAFLLLAILGLFIIKTWLSFYTNHGQALVVPDFIEMDFEEAEKLAKDKSFELVISDSVFLVNHPPKKILSQDPPVGFKVKENRKIYTTITKVVPDMVKLPDLVGGNDDYRQYSRKLERIGITPKIIDRKYSIKLARNTILEIRFDGENITDKVKDEYRIPMGSTLEFIVSDSGGGTVEIPNLVCKTYDAAKFLIQNYGLKVGHVTMGDGTKDPTTAYVQSQSPRFSAGRQMDLGAPVDLILSNELPKGCDGGDDYSN